MIALAPGTKVYLASKPVSMRLGFDGLAALVRPLFTVEPYGWHVFLFRSKSGTYLKTLHWDGTGLCLFAKRLERHRFVWPPLVGRGVILTPAQFALLIEAMDWRAKLRPSRLSCLRLCNLFHRGQQRRHTRTYPRDRHRSDARNCLPLGLTAPCPGEFQGKNAARVNEWTSDQDSLVPPDQSSKTLEKTRLTRTRNRIDDHR